MIKRKHYIPCLFLLPCITLFLCSFTTLQQGNERANVTSARTPVNTKKGGTLWTRSFAASDGRYTYNSDPVICNTVLYIANYNTLYELDKKKGTILRTMTLSAQTNPICHMLLEGNSLMIPLSGGKIECVDIRTMTSQWQSRSFGGQSLSTLYYENGCLYAGTVTMNSGGDSAGVFYCINTTDGSTQWTYDDSQHPGGYYGSGAIAQGGRLYFAGDNGILVSHSLTDDTVYDTITLTQNAKIRSGITYDPDTDSLYTADTAGSVYRIPLESDGSIKKAEILSSSTVPSATSLRCTSTPTIWNGRLYIGCLADGYGHLSVLDTGDLHLLYTVQGEQAAEIKSSPLVSTAYSSPENNDRVYVYISANNIPGGIYYLMDDSTCVRGTLQTLYTPASAKQFCMSSITADKEGTLYYSNDSNTLFAVSEVENSSDRIGPSPTTPARNPSPSPLVPSASPDPAKKISSSTSKPKKPSKIKIKKKKKKVIVTWKKPTKKSQTVLYIKYGKGKWTKRIIKTKMKYSVKRKKKTLYLRLRSRLRSNKKWIYSRYTKTYKIRSSK